MKKKSYRFSTENIKVLQFFFTRHKKILTNCIFLEISRKLYHLHTIFIKYLVRIIYFVNKKKKMIYYQIDQLCVVFA